jgi:hypothetical protein
LKISKAEVVAKREKVGEPRNMEESLLGAEGNGELPLRAEGLRLMSLPSVGGTAKNSPEADEPLNMEEQPLGTDGKNGLWKSIALSGEALSSNLI